MLMSDRVYLWTLHRIRFIYQRVGEAVEVTDTKAVVAFLSTIGILDKEIPYPLEFGEERLRDRRTRVRGVVDSGVTQLGFGIWMYPRTQANLVRTRASASSPGTMATFPERTSSRRRRASLSHRA